MFELLIILIVCMSLGSFANVCIYRLPLNKNIALPFSFCPKCNEKIKYIYNIPIFSFLFLRGRSACCYRKISLNYPIVEVAIVLAGLYFFYMQGYSWLTISSLTLFIGLVIIFMTDLKHNIILDSVSYFLALTGIFVSYLDISPFQNINVLDSLFGGIVCGIIVYLIAKIYFLVRKSNGLGIGDIKMITMIGFWTGLQTAITIVVISAMIGFLVAIVLLLLNKIHWKQPIPYGSLLSVTTIFILIINIHNHDMIDYFKIILGN